MSPYSSCGVIRVSGSPEITNCFEKTIFTQFIIPKSISVHPHSEEFSLNKGENNVKITSAWGWDDNDWIFIFSSSVSLMGNTNLATFPQYINACGFGITSSTVTYRINAWASSNCGSSHIQTYKCKRVTVTHNWWEYLHFLFYDRLTYASESFSIRLKLIHAMRQNVQRENTNTVQHLQTVTVRERFGGLALPDRQEKFRF